MATLIGKYVPTFEEATHALPQGMHMNADYPFMLPPIVEKTTDAITIQGKGGQRCTLSIKRRGKHGELEYAVIEQSSAYEKIFGKKPTKFRLLPFLDTGGK